MYIQGPIKHLKKDDFSRQFANLGFIEIYVSINQEPSVHRFSKQVCHNLCQLCFRETIINLPHCTVSSDHSHRFKYLSKVNYTFGESISEFVISLTCGACFIFNSLPRNVPIMLQIYPLLSYSIENYLFSLSLATRNRNGHSFLMSVHKWFAYNVY